MLLCLLLSIMPLSCLTSPYYLLFSCAYILLTFMYITYFYAYYLLLCILPTSPRVMFSHYAIVLALFFISLCSVVIPFYCKQANQLKKSLYLSISLITRLGIAYQKRILYYISISISLSLYLYNIIILWYP